MVTKYVHHVSYLLPIRPGECQQATARSRKAATATTSWLDGHKSFPANGDIKEPTLLYGLDGEM